MITMHSPLNWTKSIEMQIFFFFSSYICSLRNSYIWSRNKLGCTGTWLYLYNKPLYKSQSFNASFDLRKLYLVVQSQCMVMKCECRTRKLKNEDGLFWWTVSEIPFSLRMCRVRERLNITKEPYLLMNAVPNSRVFVNICIADFTVNLARGEERRIRWHPSYMALLLPCC